jgi:hypothetical protein
MSSSGTWRLVALVRTGVLEESFASNFRVEKSERVMALAVA